MHAGRISMITRCLVIGLVLGSVGVAQAGWVDNFDQPTFDTRWGQDIPDANKATISLDTTNDWVQFKSLAAIDMWGSRNNAPILWTATPSGASYIETHVASPTTQGTSVAGLTVYENTDGANPNFSLGLDHWNVNGRLVKLQGLGNNNPNTSTSATGGEAWLRLELYPDAGAAGADRYIAKYKLAGTDPWSELATLDRDVANARMGLFLKGNAAGKIADFSYAAAGAIPTIQPGDVIGIDLANGPNTPGAGAETNFNLVTGDGTIGVNSVKDTTGAVVPSLSITSTGIAGQMGEFDLGFGASGVGDYSGTPFSDLSFNDGVYRNGSTGTIDVMLSGLDDSLTYNVLGVAGGPGTQNSTILYTVDGTTLSQTYNETRAGNALYPLSFSGVSTDGIGNLTISMGAASWFGVSGLTIEAVGTAVVVPEPTTIWLFAMGLFGFIGFRRLRGKSS